LDKSLASVQEIFTRVTHPDWLDESTGSRRELQIFTHSLAPLRQTMGLQYTGTRMGVNYKLRACKKRNTCWQGGIRAEAAEEKGQPV